MARTSSFGDRRSKLSFDRVDQSDSDFSDRTLEIPAEIDLAAKEFRSVTWVYDTVNDTVIWSRPLEELFGFPAGVPGFTLLHEQPQFVDTPVRLHTSAGTSAWSTDPIQFATSDDLATSLLAPVLAPIRAGAPLADIDLRMTVVVPGRCRAPSDRARLPHEPAGCPGRPG